MIQKKKKTVSINRKLVTIMLTVVLAQGILFLLIIFFSGQMKLFSDNSFSLLEDNVYSHAANLSGFMKDAASNMEHYGDALSASIEAGLKEENKTAEDLASDRNLSYELICSVYDELVTLQRRSKTTGVFLALTDGSEKNLSEFSGIYLRDYDPDINLSESDLIMEIGSGQIAMEHSLSLDVNWKANYDLTGDEEKNRFLTVPLAAVRENPGVAMEKLGYWSEPFSLYEGEDPIITYSIPLIGEDGESYGVIGLEISQEYLEKYFSENITGTQMAESYTLAWSREGKQISYIPNILLEGILPGNYEEGFELNKEDSKKSVVPLDDGDYYVCHKRLNLYDRSSPYYDRDWSLLGFSRYSILYADFNAIARSTVIAVLVSMLSSILLIHLLSSRLNRPIQQMVGRIRKKEDNQLMQLETTYINELDELGQAIVDMNNHICENADREKKKLEYERDYDILTHLLNHRAFKERVAALLREDTGKLGAMVMWDLDNLKSVNDNYGHDFGDYYIRSAAKILGSLNLKGGIVGHISGDEFLAYIPDCKSRKSFLALMEDIKKKLNSTVLYLADDKVMNIRASAGIAWYPKDAVEYEELKKKADFAMYDTKNSYKGFYKEFNNQIYERDAMLVEGSVELNRIIDEQDVTFAFQPIVDVHTADIFAYEALMRPHSEQLSTPMELMRVARVQSKLFEIEKLTVNGVIRACVEQREALGNCKIFMNSIPNQLYRAKKGSYLLKHQDVLKNVVLEIIESEQADFTCMERKRSWANKFGAGIALDDYGSGYNSESTLLYIAPQYIKIDMEIIQGISEDSGRQKLVGNLISYAKLQKMKIVAEGVENEEDLRFLVQAGIDYIQGFYLAMPDKEILPLSQESRKKLLEIQEEIGSERDRQQ
ncbi:MAG: EAL domain-containing protein [Lachnospiraceae bacterium]|nr:EAL domain-containing protein [Lachnospiraceae bacterium]